MPAATKKVLVSLSVRIDVLNSTKLKKFSFQLDKTTPKPDEEKWTITFDLLERDKKSDTFGEATIHVLISVVADTEKAATEATAKANDFTVAQTEHVLTAVAAASRKLKAGTITQEQFDAIVKQTMSSGG